MKITFSLCTKSTHEDIKTVVWTVATAAMEDTCFRRRWGGCAVQSGATRNQVRTGTRFSSLKLTCTRSPKHAAVKSDGLWPNYRPLRVKAPCQSVCSGHLPTKRYFRSSHQCLISQAWLLSWPRLPAFALFIGLFIHPNSSLYSLGAN